MYGMGIYCYLVSPGTQSVAYIMDRSYAPPRQVVG